MNTKINSLQAIMRSRNLPLLAITAGPDLLYLTGLGFHVSERPAILLIPANGQPSLIHPELEAEKVKNRSIVPLSSFP